MNLTSRPINRPFDYCCVAALFAVFVFAAIHIVLAIRTNSITAVKPKGSAGAPDIAIAEKADPIKFWGNVAIYFGTGSGALGLGCFVLYKLRNEKDA